MAASACEETPREPIPECAIDERREQACGLNGNGIQSEICEDEGWITSGNCDDPDVCAEESVRPSACGLNGAGNLEQRCIAGTWVDSTECMDPDECANGDTRVLLGGGSCGAPDFEIGVELETCVTGQWSAEGECRCGDTPYFGVYTISNARTPGPSSRGGRGPALGRQVRHSAVRNLPLNNFRALDLARYLQW